MVGNSLEDLHELLEAWKMKDDIQFGWKLDSVMNKREIVEKEISKREICGKWFASSLARNKKQKC